MKKYVLSVFVLVALFVFSSPFFQVYASVVNPNEPCNASTVAASTNQPCVLPSGVLGFIVKIQGILNSIVPVLIALGVVFFVYGVVMYMIADGEEAKTKGRDSVVYGLIGLAIIIGLWGLVNLISNTFGLNNSLAPTADKLKGLLPQ